MKLYISKLLLLRGLLIILAGSGFWWVNPKSKVYSLPLNQTNDIPRFEEKKCSTIFPSFSWVGLKQGNFRCGHLITYENYDSPSADKIIHLDVIVALSSSSTQPEPLIYLDGGPGSPGITADAPLALSLANYFERDFVQFGQRGSYHSTPYLYCEEYRQAILNNWERALSEENWNGISIRALEDCLEHPQNGQNFEDAANFNSRFNALDVMYLIQELGYKKANLYGLSYGTLLAQHVLQISPRFVSSVVLDGVVPLDVDTNAHAENTKTQSIERVLDACKTNPECQNAYPDLETTFNDVLKRLAQAPIHIAVDDKYYEAEKLKSKTYQNVYLDEQGFLQALGSFSYSRENIKEIPRIIYAADNGNFKEIGNNYLFANRSQFFAWEMYYSVFCTEFAHFETNKDFWTELCNTYENTDNKSYGDVKITNNQVPVLIFNGDFDPITPPEYGNQVAHALLPATVFNLVSPVSAHGSGVNFSDQKKDDYNECTKRVVKNFMDHPSQRPDDESCWNEIQTEKIKFNTSNQEIYIHQLRLNWQALQQKAVDTFNAWLEGFKDWWQEQQEKIKDALNQWWKEQQKRLTDALYKWWQDFQRDMTQWLEKQFIQWLNQCFGSAFLPVVIVVRIWISHRKRE